MRSAAYISAKNRTHLGAMLGSLLVLKMLLFSFLGFVIRRFMEMLDEEQLLVFSHSVLSRVDICTYISISIMSDAVYNRELCIQNSRFTKHNESAGSGRPGRLIFYFAKRLIRHNSACRIHNPSNITRVQDPGGRVDLYFILPNDGVRLIHHNSVFRIHNSPNTTRVQDPGGRADFHSCYSKLRLDSMNDFRLARLGNFQ